MFVLRSNMVLSSVNTRNYSVRLFISHVNSNVVKYALFHRTAMLWNTLDDYRPPIIPARLIVKFL